MHVTQLPRIAFGVKSASRPSWRGSGFRFLPGPWPNICECAAVGPNREMARVPDAAPSTRSSTGWSLPPGSKSAMMCRQDSRLAQGAALDLRPPVKQQDGLACGRFAASGYPLSSSLAL